MSDYLRSEVVEAISNRNAAFVVGAGVSILASQGDPVGSWSGLIEAGINRCVDLDAALTKNWQKTSLRRLRGSDTSALISLAQDIEDRLKRWPGRQYAKWLADTVGSLKVRSPQILDALTASGAPLLTTNYDGLIEAYSGLEPVTWDQLAEMQDEVREPGHSVIHLHGFWRRPDTIVFGYDSYSNVIGDSALEAFLHSMLSIKSIIFTGFGQGIEDPNFSGLTTWLTTALRPSGIAPVILVRNREYNRMKTRCLPLGINVICYGDEYEDLAIFLADMITEAKVQYTDTRCVEFTWQMLSARLMRLQRRITRSFSPDFVVATSGPGNFAPAYCLAHWGSEPPLLTAVSFPRKPSPSVQSREFGKVATLSDWLLHQSDKWDVYLPNIIRNFPRGAKALIFDDRVVGGQTQPAIAKLLISLGYDVRCAALVVDPSCVDRVDFYEEVVDSDFVFPWGGRYGRGERTISRD